MTIKLHSMLAALCAILCVLHAAPALSAQAAQGAQRGVDMRFSYERDEKIAEWMKELETHIIMDYLDDATLRERGRIGRGGEVIDYSYYSGRAKKMVKRARKLWGDDHRDTIYVSGVALLVYINHRLKIKDISTAKARELVPEALIAPPREIFYAQPHAEYLAWKLAALHDLTAARVERFAYNNAGAQEYYDKAISKFRKLGDMGMTDSLEVIDTILVEMSNEMLANRCLYDRYSC